MDFEFSKGGDGQGVRDEANWGGVPAVSNVGVWTGVLSAAGSRNSQVGQGQHVVSNSTYAVRGPYVREERKVVRDRRCTREVYVVCNRRA